MEVVKSMSQKTLSASESDIGSVVSMVDRMAGMMDCKKALLESGGDIIHFVLLISRQGKVRLTKWYSPYSQKERTKVIRELSGVILTRGPKLCNFVEWRGYKIIYKRYASLYFCMCIDQDDNELEVLEMIHHYVEILDRYFGSVCELDLIFNFHKAYYILDELLLAGELQESSKKTVARLIAAQDSLVETAKEQATIISNMIGQATK
ncbi:AP complex, mu/sigma subunit [Dillenia turbinata]|uniref:Adaptor AP-1 19 kDa protein n=1 Tax=Dillenia turbinata TaxID=194707 RepID=A0AAN8YVK1_9MAGN